MKLDCQKKKLKSQKWPITKLENSDLSSLSQCAKDVLGASFSLSPIFIMGTTKTTSNF